MRQQPAPVAPFQPQPSQIRAPYQNLRQQLSRRKPYRLPIAQFFQNDVVAATFQTRKHLFQESHWLFKSEFFANGRPERKCFAK
jgi:hypothetical protein